MFKESLESATSDSSVVSLLAKILQLWELFAIDSEIRGVEIYAAIILMVSLFSGLNFIVYLIAMLDTLLQATF